MTQIEELAVIPSRALAVGAHPDDVELFAGGTLAKWIAGGCEVWVAVCSNGGAGTTDPDASRSQVGSARVEEQQAAAKALGVTNLVMLGFADGALEDTADFRRAVVRLIRECRPHTVLTHEPHRPGALLHRDHRIVGTVVQDAVYPFARDPLHYPEQIAAGLEPHKVSEVLLWDTDEPNSIVDISGFVEAQAAALSCHRSQLGGLECGEHPASWLDRCSREAAAAWPFESGETFRRLVAPA